MKWLFAILVALNIIIFANVVTQRMQNKEEVVVHEAPAAINPIVIREEIIDHISSDVVEPSIEQQIVAKKVQKEALKKQQDGQGKTSKNDPMVNEQVAKRLASCTAQITIPEDAYHRLKGMLNRWSNAASKVVVKNENSDIMGRQYQVLFSTPDNATDIAKEANSKGFTAQANGNIVTLGVFKDRAPAEALLDKARAAGYSQANVMERSLGGKENLSEAKYKVLFLQVDNQAVSDINAIVKPYGSLERGACQR